MKAEGRTYKVIRNHTGEVTVLDTVLNEDGTISFQTDRFSTYALAYADEEGSGTNPENKPSEGGSTPAEGNTKPSADDNKDSNTKPSVDVKAPQTGDNRSVMMYVIICLVALAAIVVAKKNEKY